MVVMIWVSLVDGCGDKVGVGWVGWIVFGVIIVFMGCFVVLFWIILEMFVGFYLDFDDF